MEKLYKPNKNYLDADVLCPIKMEKVRKVLQRQLLCPDYKKWDKNDELAIMKDLSLRKIPEQYTDIQLMARKLYIGYIFSKFGHLEGAESFKNEFNEILYEEMIE